MLVLVAVGLFCSSLPLTLAVDPAPASTVTPSSSQPASGANSTTTPTGGISSVVRQVGGTTSLPDYGSGHASQNYRPGASQLTSTVYYILDFFKYILGGIAVLMIVISGIKLILSARSVQDVMSREKETLRFAFSGLLIILLADSIIRNVFFGEEGEIYRTGTDMTMAATQGEKLALGVTGMLRIFIPSIAILFFVIAAYRLMISRGEPEAQKKAQTQITWSIIGIILAGLSEIVVFQILFPKQGTTIPDAQAFARQMVTMTNWVTGFISTIAVTMLIYAGYLYVTSLGGEGIQKAKTVMIGAIVGLLISMAAFGLVNTFVKLEPLTSSTTTQEIPVPTG